MPDTEKIPPKLWVIVTLLVAVIGCGGIVLASVIGIIPDILRPETSLTITPNIQITPTNILVTTNLQTATATTPVALAHTSTPQNTPTITPPPTETNTPTSTPAPTTTRDTDTPPGTILSVGQTWTQDGISVQFEKMEFNFGNIADLWFSFYNNSNKTIFFHLNENVNITMQDNNGKIFTWDYAYQEDIVLEPGESHREEVFKEGAFSNVVFLIITMDIPGTIFAQWKYE